jgi:hypothetical protein
MTIASSSARRPNATVAALGLVLAALGGGCKRKAGAADAGPPDIVPALGPISLNDLTVEEALPPSARLDTQALMAELQRRLRESGIFAAAADDAGTRPVARVRVDLAVEDVRADEKGAARAQVRFRVDPRPSGLSAPHWSEDVQAAAETVYPLKPEPDRKAMFAKLVSRMLGDLTAGYLARQKLWRGSEQEVAAALSADGGEARSEAIRVVAERRLTGEVPALLKLLSADEETVRDAALGALVELRERRAVTEIAKQRSMRDQREMRKILDAIATLGGEEAVEYLSFVADAHEDEEIKAMAKQALDRLKRRAAASGTGGEKR